MKSVRLDKSCRLFKVHRFRNLNKSDQGRIRRLYPSDAIIGSSYIIHVDSSGNDPTFTYDDPESAIIFSKKSIKAMIRGDEKEISSGIQYIPPYLSKHRLQYDSKKIYDRGWRRGVGVALVTSLMLLAFMEIFIFHDRIATDELSLEEGYQSILDLPQEYLDWVSDHDLATLYASDGVLDEDINQLIKNLTIEIDLRNIADKRLVPFYKKLMADNHLSQTTKEHIRRMLVKLNKRLKSH